MMSASGPPNGDGANLPTDPGTTPSVTNTETSDSNTTIPEEELERFYVTRHGRRFHIWRSRYFLPADGEEATRLKEQHEIFQRLLGADYDQLLAGMLAPSGGGSKVVLDLGCGPGNWVEELSTNYTSAHFIGIDLVPMALQQIENAHFECYDISQDRIRRQNGSATVIHARCLSFGYNDFNQLLREAHRVLAPGGLLFSVEIDWRLEHQSNFPHFNMQFTRQFISRVAACAMVANAGAAWDPTLIPAWLADAGFVNIQQEVREIPVGPWMGSQAMQELGDLVQRMYIDFVAAMRPALLSLPDTGVDDLVAGVTHELESEGNTGWSIPVLIVTAFKG